MTNAIEKQMEQEDMIINLLEKAEEMLEEPIEDMGFYMDDQSADFSKFSIGIWKSRGPGSWPRLVSTFTFILEDDEFWETPEEQLEYKVERFLEDFEA